MLWIILSITVRHKYTFHVVPVMPRSSSRPSYNRGFCLIARDLIRLRELTFSKHALHEMLNDPIRRITPSLVRSVLSDEASVWIMKCFRGERRLKITGILSWTEDGCLIQDHLSVVVEEKLFRNKVEIRVITVFWD